MKSVSKVAMFMMILLACTAGISLGVPVTGTRTLPAGYQSDTTQISVTLDVEVDEADKPNGVIVTETLPDGWTLVSATPAQQDSENTTGDIKWVFFGAGVTDTDMDIQYVVSLPSGETGEITFSGDLKYTYNEDEITEPFSGDLSVIGPLDTANGTQCTVSASSPVLADGTSASTVIVTVKNIAGTPLVGIPAAGIVVSATGAGNTITQPTAATNASGQTTATLRSTVAGEKTVSVTIGQVSVTDTAIVQFTQVPTQVAFTGQPVGPYTAGGTISVTVAIQDASGSTITSNTNNITIGLGQNPGSGVLSGTLTKAASGGVAVFNNLSINKTGTGYTIVATSGTLTSATSSPFSVGAATPSKLVFTTSPGTTAAMGSLSPAPRVSIYDSLDNLATDATSQVDIAVKAGTGVSGATLTGTLSVNAVNGVATFGDLKLNRAGTGYQLTATSTGLTPIDSAPFAITAEPALTIVKTGPAAPVDPNTAVTYTITYGNDGLADAHGCTIVETLPAGLTYVSSTGLYSEAARTITWSPGTIAALVTDQEVTFEARVDNNPQGGTITNSNLTIDCDETAPVTALPVTTTVNDTEAPSVSGRVPAANAEHAPRQPLISLHVKDSGSGVKYDGGTVVITVEGDVVYNGAAETAAGVYDTRTASQTVKGICRRTGTAADYKFSFQPSNTFDYEQQVDVQVNAVDVADNSSSTVYHFVTLTRAFGSNAKVNSDASTLAQDNPATAMDSSGNIWVVWDQATETAGDTDIYIGKLVDGAIAFGASQAVYTGLDAQSNPVIAIDDTDTLYVAWQGNDPNGHWDVFVSSSADGATWSTPIKISAGDTKNTSDQTLPSIGIDQANPHTLYIAYQDNRAGHADIWLASSADGTSWAEMQVTTETSNQTQPVLVVDPSNNNVYVGWTDDRNLATDGLDVYGLSKKNNIWNTPKALASGVGDQKNGAGVAYGSAHSLWIGDVNVFYGNHPNDEVPYMGADIIDDSDVLASDPSLALRVTGSQTKVFAAWTDSRDLNNNSDTDIYYAESGSPFGTNILINDDTGTSAQGKPAVGVDLKGRPYVVWVDARNGNQDIYFAGTMSFGNPIPTQIVRANNRVCVQSKDSANLCVDMPDAALPEGIAAEDITIAEVENAPAMAVGGNAVGLKYEFGPSGTVFTEPVLIRIPLTEDSGYNQHYVYRYDPNDLASPFYPWTDEGILNPASKITDANGTYLEVGVTHFSVYGGSGSTAVSGGGGGGGCALSPYGNGNPVEFFLPIFMCAAIFFGSRWIQSKRRSS